MNLIIHRIRSKRVYKIPKQAVEKKKHWKIMKINNNNYILRFEFSVAEIYQITKSEMKKIKFLFAYFKQMQMM